MGQFTDLKITDQELANNGMTSLVGTKFTNQAVRLKQLMDGDGTFVAGKYNDLTTALESETAAASIGASIQGISGKTVQAILTALHNGSISSFSYNQNGTITITKTDGTSLTASISGLIDAYVFNDSSTILMNETGSGNKRSFSPSIKANSVSIDMLADDAKNELKSYGTNSLAHSIESKSWAVGTTGTRPNEDADNSKYYYERTVITYNDFFNRYNMNFLTQGNLMAGYYGKVKNLITGADLCTSVGLTAGTLAFSGDITWLKFSHKYRTLFVADRAIRTSISWDQIQAQNLVKGKVITIGDNQYLCRLMTGGNSNPASAAGGEWNDLIGAFTPNDADSHWNGVNTFCQEQSQSSSGSMIFRGGTSVWGFSWVSSGATKVFRPVLELL